MLAKVAIHSQIRKSRQKSFTLRCASVMGHTLAE